MVSIKHQIILKIKDFSGVNLEIMHIPNTENINVEMNIFPNFKESWNEPCRTYFWTRVLKNTQDKRHSVKDKETTTFLKMFNTC